MKNYIIIAIIIVFVIGGYFVYQNIFKISPSNIQPEDQIQPNETRGDKLPSMNDVDDICKANTKKECESNPDCYWKYQGGKITAHYNCCPKNKEKSPGRCNIMVD